MSRPYGRFYVSWEFSMAEEYANELEMGDQEQMRLAKLREMREMGIDPYPPRGQRTHMARDAIAAYEEWEAKHGSEGSGVGGQESDATGTNPQSAISNPQSNVPPPQVTL